MSAKLLKEMFGLVELTPLRHAETELNMSQSVAKAPRKYTQSTAKAQSDVDSGRSVAKKDEAAGESGSGLRITGDPATLQALQDVLTAADQAGLDDDQADWVDDCIRALRMGAKSGNVSVPAFKATPGLDTFNDAEGAGPEDEEY